MDIDLAASLLSKYPPLATSTSMNSSYLLYLFPKSEVLLSLAGPLRRLEPMTWQSLTACVLAGLCALLNFLRSFPFLNVIVIDDEVSKICNVRCS